LNIATSKHNPARTIRRIAALAALVMVATACNPATWGFRESFRNYAAGPIGHGAIEVSDGAVWTDGPGTGKGPFTFPLESSTFDPTDNTGELILGGSFSIKAHENATLGGYVLDMTFSNIRVTIDDTEGILYADVKTRPFEGTNPPALPDFVTYPDAAVAELDLSGVDWTPNADGKYVISDAPAVGIDETMEDIGMAAFYPSPVALDPFSISFDAPTAALTPTLHVSKTTGLVPGETVTVIGTGFDPDANTGNRPPLAGQKSGFYVVFGNFAETWQPSAGAPSSARTVISQRWALPDGSRAAVDPGSTNALYVDLDERGNFVAELTVSENAGTGNYGIYTYAGSGAVNAAQELVVPVSFQAAA